MNTNVNLYNEISLQIGKLGFKLMIDSNISNQLGFAGIFHSHTYYELFFAVNGEMKVILQDRIINVPDNSFFVIPPDVLHYTSSRNQMLERFSISFQIMSGENSAEGQRFLSLFYSLTPWKIKESRQIHESFQRMESYYFGTNPDKLHLMASCFYEILYLCKSTADAEDACISPSQNHMDENYRTYVIDDYINKNFSRDISLASLANLVILSECQVNRILQKKHGQSFKQRVIYLRMKNAARLLCDTRLKVKDIASSVGYESAHGFNAICRKTYGITPEEYRRDKRD